MPEANVLERIVGDVARRLRERQQQLPLVELRALAAATPPPPSFRTALAEPGLAVIAEIKRASPSKGLLAPEFDHCRIARAYRDGGARAISVLTEEDSFLGSLQYLRDVNRELGGAIPLLRKDFLFEEYQIWEAREAGASAVLLIVAVLQSADRVAGLIAAAARAGLDALVEVHDETELEVALAAGSTILGVNNRDLRTFHTDLAVSERLRPRIPADRVMVAESGIHGAVDARRLAELPVDAVLVGEHFMTSPDPAASLRALTAWQTQPAPAP